MTRWVWLDGVWIRRKLSFCVGLPPPLCYLKQLLRFSMLQHFHTAVLSSVMSNSATPWTAADTLQLHGVQLIRLLWPWNFPSKNSGVSYHVLLQGIFPTQGSNSCLPHLLNCRRILHYWTTKETLSYYTWEENKNISHSTCENEDQILHIKGIESHILNVVYVALIAGVTHFCDSCH